MRLFHVFSVLVIFGVSKAGFCQPTSEAKPKASSSKPTTPQFKADALEATKRSNAKILYEREQRMKRAQMHAQAFRLAATAPTAGEQYKQMEQLLSNRNAELGELVTCLDPEKPLQASTAMYLLGFYRQVEAIHRIANLIDLERPNLDHRLVEADVNYELIIYRYPAVQALAMMGRDSTPQMLKVIANNERELPRRLAISVIMSVESPKVARFLLSESLVNESDPIKKSRLQTAEAFLIKER